MILILQILEDTSPFPIATHGQSSWEWIKTLIGTHAPLSPIFPRTVLNCAYLHTAFQLYPISIVSREDTKRKHLMRSIYATVIYTSVIICVHIICIWNIHINIHTYIYIHIYIYLFIYLCVWYQQLPFPPAPPSIIVFHQPNFSDVEVENIRRFGGSTSPAMPWPNEEHSHADGAEDKLDRLEKIILRATKTPSWKRS